MSTIAIVLYDNKANDEQMDMVEILINKIVPKINKALGIILTIEFITDLSLTSADKCDHVFVLKGNKVSCTLCPKEFEVRAQLSEEKKTVDDVSVN